MASDSAREEHVLLVLLNALRVEHGLVPLRTTPRLDGVALAHARDMAAHGYFAHDDRQGRSGFGRLHEAGYKGGLLGENIAGGNADARATFAQWMGSPPHLATMLTPGFRALGIGRAQQAGSPLGTYWVTVFGDYVDASASS
ncbi:MAG: CAP domain-containing protein [Polyangiales bacterium]